jgi:hypothetical protein
MCKHTVEKIYNIAEECGINKIVIITNHLKFMGTLCQKNEKDKDDCNLTITDAKMWRLEDICTCTEPDCKCNEANFCSLPFLHVNLGKVVAFSLVSE